MQLSLPPSKDAGMTEDLQSLIERIQRDALEKSEKQAAEILSRAEEEAAAVLKAARDQAAATQESAERQAATAAEQGRKALAQAARDTLIRVEQGVDDILSQVVFGAVDEALTPEIVSQMLIRLAEAYGAKGGKEAPIEALVSPEDEKQIVSYLQGLRNRQLAEGIRVVIDRDLEKGFRVVFRDGRASHDFSREAIAEALTSHLRPQMADLVRRSARDSAEEGNAP